MHVRGWSRSEEKTSTQGCIDNLRAPNSVYDTSLSVQSYLSPSLLRRRLSVAARPCPYAFRGGAREEQAAAAAPRAPRPPAPHSMAHHRTRKYITRNHITDHSMFLGNTKDPVFPGRVVAVNFELLLMA